VGSDFKELNVFKKKKIDVSGVSREKGKTFHWAGKYHFDLNTRDTLKTELGVFANFKPKLDDDQKKAQYVFLGNIHPSLQLSVLKQIKKPKLVGLDTMNLWIENHPKELKQILKQVDVFIINDSEARELSKQHNIYKAAKKILSLMGKQKSDVLIIKRGEYGLLMFSNSYRHGYSLPPFHLPGLPLEEVIDPTGAGDSFAGGFMGHLARTNDLSLPNLKKACVYGSVMAGFCVENFGTKNLHNLTPQKIKNRFRDFKKLTN